MEQARIPGVTTYGNDYTMLLRWDETNPMVIYFGFVLTRAEGEGCTFWVGGRKLFCQALLDGHEAGEGHLRIMPSNGGDTFTIHLENPELRTQADLEVPERPVRHFLLKTLTKVSMLDEHMAAQAYIDRWLAQVLEGK